MKIHCTADSSLSLTSSPSSSPLELGLLSLLSGCELPPERSRLLSNRPLGFIRDLALPVLILSVYSEFRNLSFFILFFYSLFLFAHLKALRYEREKRFDGVLVCVEHWSENSGYWVGYMAERR